MEFYIVLILLCVALGAAFLFYRQSFQWKLEAQNWKSKWEADQTLLAEGAREKASTQTHLEDIKEKYFSAKAKLEALEINSDSLRETFQALAHQTLEGQTKQFLNLAEQTLEKHTQMAKGDLEKREQSINHLVSPLASTLEALQKHTHDLEKERQSSYNSVFNELRRVNEISNNLSSETRALKDALKKPHVRGRWGETQLKTCVELAGMSEFTDVNFQDISKNDDGANLIPDLTVKMPGGRVVLVDAKTPLDGFLASLEATSDELRNFELERHGKQVLEHVRNLAKKSYHEKVKDTADFTVMFLPNESFLYAALETQPRLVDIALDKKILIATPPTFVGLLKVIYHGWNEDKLAKNAEKIKVIGVELHKRAVEFVETYKKVGASLTKATAEYQKGFNQLNSRVIVSARKMEALGSGSAKEFADDNEFVLIEAVERQDEESLKLSSESNE